MDETLLAAVPAAARKKLDSFGRTVERGHAERRGLADDAAATRLELRRLQGIRHRQERSTGAAIAETDDETKLRAELSRLQQMHDEAVTTLQPVSSLLTRCSDWVKAVAATGAKITAAPHFEPPPIKGDIKAAVDACRRKIERLDREIEAVERTPTSPDLVRQRALAVLDALAERGKPHVYTVGFSEDPIGLRERLTLSSMPAGDGRSILQEGSVQFLCWVLRDILAERISTLIADAPSADALTDEQRDVRLRDLATRKLAEERHEESLIEKAAASGLMIERRPDADPRAVLSVTDE